jgi:cyclohexadienyl dehydratase
LNALLALSVDAVVTDTAEAPAWLTMAAGARVLGPITRDRKGYLVRADQPKLAAELDDWLLAREADGTLASVREVFFGEGAGKPIATPLLALLAAVDERLSLMPLVAVAKRNAGVPLVVPRRETIVLVAAVRSVEAAAAARDVGTPDEALVRGFFRAQIEASKQLQRAALADPRFDRPETTPDVDAVLRPALIRIGEKIARMVVVLPSGLAPSAILEATREQLRTPRLSVASIEAIAASVSALSDAAAQ